MKKRMMVYLTEKDIEQLIELCLIYYKNNRERISTSSMLSLCIGTTFDIESNYIAKTSKRKAKRGICDDR